MTASHIRIERLSRGDEVLARALFAMMSEVFEEEHDELGDDFVARLLRSDQLWVLAATRDGSVVGGLTAHTLPMTRSESHEVFIYDIAVLASEQRKGIGKQLVTQLISMTKLIGVESTFVVADNEDEHALDFYRALGGVASPVTMFTL